MSSEDHYAFGFSNSLEETFIELPKEEPSRNNCFISARCDPFYGYSSENASKFLSEFRSYCTLQNLIDDKRTIAAFHLLHWYGSIHWTIRTKSYGQCCRRLSRIDTFPEIFLIHLSSRNRRYLTHWRSIQPWPLRPFMVKC